MTQQVGGDHYSTQTGYEHWDWCWDVGACYYVSAATKYVARCYRKNGEEDLRKARTYIEKRMALESRSPRVWAMWWRLTMPHRRRMRIFRQTERLDLNFAQTRVLWHCACREYRAALVGIDLLLAGLTSEDTELQQMRAYTRSLIDHPSPFGYDEASDG